MGIGATGATAELIKFLVRSGANVTATDLKTEKELSYTLELLKGLDVELRLGGHSEEDFKRCDILYVNPAVSLENDLIKTAVASGAKIDTEMNLFYRMIRQNKIIGVTGTKGKTTTTRLICHLLQGLGRKAVAGGNMGISLINEAAALPQDTWIVLELSSFQLERLRYVDFKPSIACCLKVFTEHLDHHRDFDEYLAAKSWICKNQTRNDTTILHSSLRDHPAFKTRARTFFFAKDDYGSNCFSRGNTVYIESSMLTLDTNREIMTNVINIENLLASLLAVRQAVGLHDSIGRVTELLHSFRSDKYRLEDAGTINGRIFINDSASTHPASTLNALEVFSHSRVILIFGGQNKGINLREYIEKFKSFNIKKVFVIGPCSTEIQNLLKEMSIPSETAASVRKSALAAYNQSEPNDMILFSPGLSSLYKYRNYAHRGEDFNAALCEISRSCEKKAG